YRRCLSSPLPTAFAKITFDNGDETWNLAALLHLLSTCEAEPDAAPLALRAPRIQRPRPPREAPSQGAVGHVPNLAPNCWPGPRPAKASSSRSQSAIRSPSGQANRTGSSTGVPTCGYHTQGFRLVMPIVCC
ncbi:hypothetical protein EMIHUDRAFT_361276, partial [Emiliania huxleyi CCMP1516]|uniref:Uncharacterized protein n=2 Tax=Emiliania huxleyi TaxID=2903 RepID=A0A0D3KVT8_EMIH1